MRPSSKDVTECPNGYRRYVYRVSVSVPSEGQFRKAEPHPKGPGTDIEQKQKSRFAIRWLLSTLTTTVSAYVASGMSFTSRSIVIPFATAAALGVVNAGLLSLQGIRLPNPKQHRFSIRSESSHSRLGKVEPVPAQPPADMERSLARSRAPLVFVLLMLVNGPPMWVIPAPENELALASWGAGSFLPRILGMLIAVIANVVLWILIRNDDESS